MLTLMNPYLNKHTMIIVTIMIFPIITAAAKKDFRICVDSGAFSGVSINCWVGCCGLKFNRLVRFYSIVKSNVDIKSTHRRLGARIDILTQSTDNTIHTSTGLIIL